MAKRLNLTPSTPRADDPRNRPDKQKFVPGWGLSLNWTGTSLREGIMPKGRAPGRYNWS